MPRSPRTRLTINGYNRPRSTRRSSPSTSSASSRSSVNSSRSSTPSISSRSSISDTSITPISTRAHSPIGFDKQEENRSTRRTNSSTNRLVKLLVPIAAEQGTEGPQYIIDDEGALRSQENPSTVTWECASAVVSSQQVQRTLEKPTYSRDTEYDANGTPIRGTGRILSHGKVLTKIVTMTVTTTIASTEILHNGEDGYEESRKRQRTQEPGNFSGQIPNLHTSPHPFDSEAHDEFHSSHRNTAQFIPIPADIPIASELP